MRYLQIFTRKGKIIETWERVKEKYSFTDEELKRFIFEVLEELATNEEFYKRYLEKIKEKIEKGEIVRPSQALKELLLPDLTHCRWI